jgi:hypothetical protein
MKSAPPRPAPKAAPQKQHQTRCYCSLRALGPLVRRSTPQCDCDGDGRALGVRKRLARLALWLAGR